MARSVSLTCATCGFLVPIGGPLGQAFGLCAQEMSPADGAVVSLAFGCGAHSEIALAEKEPVSAPTQDFVGFDTLDLGDDETIEVADAVADAVDAVQDPVEDVETAQD